MAQATVAAPEIEYPSSDGKRIAENTKQAFWIFLIMAGIQALLRDITDVLVATDILWYPVEGDNKTCTAPDILVAFGRPRGHRLNYLQWKEEDIAPQIVFEILSPSDTYQEMDAKLLFYDEQRVEEYYVYDPDHNTLAAYIRGQATLVRHRFEDGFTSPRLGIRFDLSGDEMVVWRPDGRRFPTPEESDELLVSTQKARLAAETRLARMSALVGKLLAGTATPEEVAELQRSQAT